MKDAKAVYAQSSDIQARSFREYRRDMKKKAIVELEFLPFLQGLLAPATAEKHGADTELRTGSTPYATNGDVPVVLAILLVLLLSAGTARFPWRKMARKAAGKNNLFF